MKILAVNDGVDSSKEFKLDIIVNLEPITDIAASSIHRVYNKDGSIDQWALIEYEDFVINVLALFDYYEFEVLDEKYSNKSKTSMYFTIYRKSESNEADIKCLFFVRISDHDYKEKSKEDRKKTEKHRKEYHEREAERLKQPKTKKRQKWKARNIIVNDETCDSYNEALDKVEKILETL